MLLGLGMSLARGIVGRASAPVAVVGDASATAGVVDYQTLDAGHIEVADLLMLFRARTNSNAPATPSGYSDTWEAHTNASPAWYAVGRHKLCTDRAEVDPADPGAGSRSSLLVYRNALVGQVVTGSGSGTTATIPALTINSADTDAGAWALAILLTREQQSAGRLPSFPTFTQGGSPGTALTARQSFTSGFNNAFVADSNGPVEAGWAATDITIDSSRWFTAAITIRQR